MIDFAWIRVEVQCCEDGTQEEPIAKVATDQIGVLALPSNTCSLPQSLFGNRRGVDKNLYIASCLRDQPAGQPFEPLLDEIVVVMISSVDRYRSPLRLIQRFAWIAIRRIAFTQHDN